MRLLKYGNNGELIITDDLDSKDTIPQYAILSHRWGADTDEVAFEDIAKKRGKQKPGYKKLELCGKQATYDSLQYFWIDTCCIDKTNKAEYSIAIQSMFHWYRNATRCYVYMSDVFALLPTTEKEASVPLWELDFQKSEWFTRGWTLQELLAPKSVEFFSHEWKSLGDRTSLKSKIHKVTTIPYAVLEGAPLSRYSVDERLRWRQDRRTKVAEDNAYSLSGIFSVDMAPVYGEGAEEAFRRLHYKIQQLEDCLRDLRPTDPRKDKERIEQGKGGLLEEACRWVFGNSSFRQWHDGPQSQLLWIKGDPGKGKTMLVCSIIDELQKTTATCVSYFFCQATDSRINNATAVLRGLMYMLVSQQTSLISHIREKYNHAGKTIFEETNAWVVLTEIFEDILLDPSLSTTYLIVDALDECVTQEGYSHDTDLQKLLKFIAKQSAASPHVKWIIASRNWPNIEEQLERAGHKVKLSLELNAESVSAAVSVFVQQRVSQLAQQKKYDRKTEDAVLKRLMLNANSTFLWVSLVCQDLQATARWNVLKKLDLFPPGLSALYKQMMQQISKSEDAELCKHVLAVIALVYRPIVLEELLLLVEQLQGMDKSDLREIIGLCGSFLTLQGETIYLVHHSAKDFLLTEAVSELFPSGTEPVHFAIFSRSLQIMSKTLRQDINRQQELGTLARDTKQTDSDPLAVLRYPCVYWVDHLCDSRPTSSSAYAHDPKNGCVDTFLRKKYLYWLEALSLCRSVSKGVSSMGKLLSLTQETSESDSLITLTSDALRFFMFHRDTIDNSPLQIYRITGNSWTESLETLNGSVMSASFSHDSTQLVSASWDKTIKIWDVESGVCMHTLQGHTDIVNSAVFSHDSTQIASASSDRTVKIWDASSGTCLHTRKSCSHQLTAAIYSHDSTQLASASTDKAFKIWDTSSGLCLRRLEGHSESVYSIAFSHDSSLLASGSLDNTVKIWDTSCWTCLHTLKGHSNAVTSVAFSHNSTQLASGSWDTTVKIWDVGRAMCLYTFKDDNNGISSVSFSHDSTLLASAHWNNTIRIWDKSRGVCVHTFRGHSSAVYSVAFSHNSTLLASASMDNTIKMWDMSSGSCLRTLEGHGSGTTSSSLAQFDSAGDDVGGQDS